MFEPRISLITLGVDDLDRARAFYEQVLGWQAAASPPGVVFFDLGGLIFSIFGHTDLAGDMKNEAGSLPPYHGWALAYNARSREEVDRLFDHLRSHGARILKAPETASWGGYSGYFADPDGHAWEVAFNPYWTVRADGRISLQRP